MQKASWYCFQLQLLEQACGNRAALSGLLPMPSTDAGLFSVERRVVVHTGRLWPWFAQSSVLSAWMDSIGMGGYAHGVLDAPV